MARRCSRLMIGSALLSRPIVCHLPNPVALWRTGTAITQDAVVAAVQGSAVPTISTAISRSQAGRWLAFAVMLTGGLLPSVDFFIINVSLPSIHASLGADPAEL